MKSSSLMFAALLAGAASLAQAQSNPNPPVDAPVRDNTSTPQNGEAEKIQDPAGQLDKREKKNAKKPTRKVQSEAHNNPNKQGTPMPPPPPNMQNEADKKGSSSNMGVAPPPPPPPKPAQ